jgi:hypothetical protein
MNENVKWALYAAIPLGVANILVIYPGDISRPISFLGEVAGAVFVWFLIIYVVLQYALNRPKRGT